MLEGVRQITWAIATILIILCGITYTFCLKGIQFRFSQMLRTLFQKEKESKGITPLQTLMMSLAGRIGVGSIAGVALAIYIGGVGSIFWMWVIALISAASTFAETVLGIWYKEKDEDDLYVGGPSYYMKKGLKKSYFGTLYAILVLVSYIIGFLGIQANTIVKSSQELFSIPSYLIGIVIIVITALIILGGVKKIADITSKLVPVMTIIYVGVALFILVSNIEKIPSIINLIITDAFRFDAFLSSFLPTFIVGLQRGLFSSEAGIGTGSIVASTTDSNNATKQGILQILGIYITTFLICTATAIIILTSNYKVVMSSDMNGIELTQYAFEFHLGPSGLWIVFVSILLFSFSTILTGYYYGESSLKYLYGHLTKKQLLFLKIMTLLFLFIGSLTSSKILWGIVDIFVAVLAILNTYAILKMKKVVSKAI